MRKSGTTQLQMFDDDATLLVKYDKVHVSRSTFKAGVSARIHRWFRLTPSFGPDLVRLMMEEMGAKQHEIVLDPFAGASTTLIEARRAGMVAYGYEINPLLHFVGATSLRWDVESKDLQSSLAVIGDKFEELVGKYGNGPASGIPFPLPAIHNVHRWWRDDVLLRLVILRECIDACTEHSHIRDFFRLCLAGVLVPDLTNVTLGRLQLHFIDRQTHDIDVWRTFARHADTMIDDMNAIKSVGQLPAATLLHGDSVLFKPDLPAPHIDLVITSPPYPNRYSYVWNTRPHLYMLGFFTGKREAGELDTRTVGGTWGTATSILMKGTTAPFNDAVEKSAGPVVAAIRQHDGLMANYCMHYFNKLAEHFVNLMPNLSSGARIAYVVGCSRLRDVYVETDVVLSELIANLSPDFHNITIHRFRKRNSGKDLHESAVYATFK